MVCPQTWAPAIIIVSDEAGNEVGFLYLKERLLLGVKTGLFFADSALGLLTGCAPEDEREVFEAGMRALLATGHVRGLRLLASPGGCELPALADLALPSNLEMQSSPAQCHLTLKLTPTYEEFLARLSYKIRRNFRYFRNRSANAGHVYYENISLAEFEPAAWEMESQGIVGSHHAPLVRAIEILHAAHRPFLAALKSAEGEILSLVGGWYEGDRVVVFIQLNSDKQHAKYSLSLVMRTHMIESFIQQGFTEILWWSGVTEPISHYCEQVPTVAVCLDNKGFLWRAVRQFLEVNRARIPTRLRAFTEMLIAPAPPVQNT
jgi:hypothetical protein